MMKKWFALLAAWMILACSVPCLAADQAIAPPYVKGKITAVVVAEEGAFVYDDFNERKEPVSALPFGAEIEIKSLGLGWCGFTEKDVKGTRYIRTYNLSFSESPFGNQIAIVFLQRSKSLPMHKTASTKAKNVTKVPDGQYVVIIERWDDFSLCRWGKYEGYLQNDCLGRDAGAHGRRGGRPPGGRTAPGRRRGCPPRGGRGSQAGRGRSRCRGS